MKHLLLSLRMILFLTFLSCITQPLHAYFDVETINGGVLYKVFYTGSRATAVGEFAYCCGVAEDFVGDVNIPSVIGATLKYKDGEDSEGNPIYSYYPISAPVTDVASYAFFNCKSLKEISFPSTCKRIRDYAFAYCSSLQEINIPNTCEYIGEYAFACSGLTSIFIPENVNGFGAYGTGTGLANDLARGTPIYGCDISKIEVHKDSQWFNFYWDEYDNRKDYGDCNAIIGWDKDWNPKLSVGCKTTIFPNTVTTIGYAAFIGQPITDITIPASINKIGQYAFHNCIGLKSITCLAATPPTIVDKYERTINYESYYDYFDESEYIFYAPFYCLIGHYDEDGNIIYEIPASYILENATLYVPKESLALYQTTIPWKYFVNIVGIDTAIPGDVDGDGKVNIDDVTTLINHLLKGSTSVNDGADANEDGNINIDDVTFLINKLLHGN